MYSASDLVGQVRWLVRSSMLRLALFLSVLFAVGMAIAVFVALTFGRNAVFERVDATLSDLANRAAIERDVAAPSFSLLVPLDRLNDLPKAFSKAGDDGISTVRLEDEYRGFEDWRAVVSKDMEGKPLLIALPFDDSEEALDLLGGILWTTAGVVILLALSTGLFFGFLAQRRLTRINTTLDRLAAGELGARTGIDTSADDLDDIAKRLDLTAAELERMVAQTRNLSASIAHDLRTPLARLRAKLEKLPDSESRGAALEEAGRISGIFDTIMRIARIEAGSGTQGFEETDLRALLDDVHDIFLPVVEDSGKRLLVETTDAASALVDRETLVQALANLIQNAIVYGGPVITLFADGREIGVVDNGPGVDPSQYDEIVKPMVRLDWARESEGTGLGLALVRAVADRHDATLSLSPQSPSGLRVGIKLTDL